MRYAICFDFPDVSDPVFAWQPQPGEPFGMTMTLANAARFDSEDVAERTLRNNWPVSSEWGAVVEVEE